MDKNEINRAFHEAIGKCWHEFPKLNRSNGLSSSKCIKCGTKKTDPRGSDNPDYCSDPRLVLREMRGRGDWVFFMLHLNEHKVIDGGGFITDLIPASYILDETGKLAVEATEFLRKEKEK